MEVEEEPQPNRVSNEKKIPQFDEAEIPQSIQSNDLDRSNDESSISIHNIDEEKPQVTSASTIVDGDESNEGKVSVLEEGLVESEGKGRDLEVDEIMGDNVEEKRSGFGGSLVNEQLTEQLPQLAEKEENFSSVEEALVGNEEKFFPLVEGLGEGGGEAKASVFHEVKQEIFEEKLSDFDQRVLKEEPQLLNEEEQVPSLEGGLGDNEGEAKAHVLDEVMQEGVEQKLLNFDGTCQNEHLKEELPLSDEKAEKVFSFEEAVVEKDEKDSSLEEGLGEKGVEAHVFDQVKDEGASSSQEELDRKEEKASSLKQEDEEDKLPVFEPSMSIVDEQTVGVKEELKGEGPGSAEGGEKVHPLQEALIEKDEKVSPCEEGLVEKEEAKDHILDETMQENVEQKPSDFDQKSVEKDEKVSPFRGESVDKYKEESDEEDAVEMDTDEGGPAMAAGRRTAMKQKSSRPRVSQGRRIRARSKPKEDESLCFICFDGGDLVLCDHRSCPKVYHPSCVNRDEEYFKAKGQWICGWHICSNCQKSAHYMCYTCTYSMCRGCIKEAEFVCVRGSKGFCQDCMKTVLLIEMNKRADETTDMVDFDDKTNWLSLFKDYWLELNAKLLLTIEELTRARNPMKEANVTSSDKETLSKMGVLQYKEEPLENSSSAHDDHGGRSSTRPGCHKESTSARKMLKKRSRNTSNKELQEAQVERTSSSGDIEWASKELLDFVAHMKNGDTTVLSHFDVQALLLQYIKQNNLRDPHRKSQIICDARLLSLFGKARVGHLEILKLLDPHLLIKEASPLATDENQGGVVDPDPSQMDAGGNSDASTKTTLDTRRKSRRKIEGGSTSLDEYAAIDVHNVSLLYLRRNLMESLLDDVDMFNENVIGAFVRIRISDSASNTYRLVQVVGTGKAAGKYKTGKKATDITLEILNLNKRDIITIDLISNQEFTEEECKRLRQSVKCGLIDRLTVAQVQEKARGLHTARVNDWLASEKLRLGHLRDRASEKGCRKEHRECVEKLQLLSTPEEHLRRLNEVPDIHVDPKMAPDYESTEDEEDLNSERQGKNKMVKYSFRERDEFSARRVGSASRKNSDVACDSNRSSPKAGLQDAVLRTSPPVRIDGLLRTEGNNVCQVSSPKTSKADVNANGTDNGIPKNSQPVIEPAQISCIQPQATPQPQTTNDVSPNKPSETDKMWHYQDPAGKIQGPFSMTQLRKWSSSGFFPTNLRIWRTSEKQEDSVLLTDAVSGKFHKDLQKQEPQPSDTNQPTNISQPTQPPSLSTTITASTSSTGCDSSKDFHALSGQTQVQNCPRPITPFPRNSTQQPSFQGRDGRSESNGRWNGNQGRQHNWHSNGPRRFPPSGRGYERQHPYRSSSGQRFSGEQLKAQPPANLPAHAPQPGSIDWASLQGAINRIIPSPSPPNLPSTMNSVGVHVSNAPTNVNPANTQENIGVLNNLQPQNKPLEPAAPPVTSGNHLVYSGSSTPQIVDGSNTDQASTGDHTVPSNKVDAAKMPTEVHEMQASEDKRIPASNPMGSSNLPDASASTSKSQSESQCFASVSAQEQGSNTLNVNPAQPLGMVYPAVPGATNMGWGTVAHGPMNMNWGAPANMNMGWAQPAQAIMNLNLGWAIPAQGMPVNPGWVAPVNQNPGWVGNANQNAAWGAMMPGSGQASMHNTSNQNAGDGGSSHPQPGVQKGGVCSFYKNGHCKKGASCNYLHS